VIPAKRAHMFVAAITHPGMRGKNNEDRYGVSAYILDQEKQIPSVLAIVADGIGGHRAGEVAAQMAVDMISQVVAASDGSEPVETLKDAVIQASEAIRSQAASDPTKRGMGATCICAWVIDDRLYTASVGDSRLYLLRNKAIRRLSIDHTWIQEALEAGAINPEQVKGHPNAHVIRRYLGSPQQVVPDIRLRLSTAESDVDAEGNQGLRLLPDDILFLCSDGLHDLVEDAEIQEVMSKGRLEEGMETLVNMANERGGHDNITIVSLQMPKVGSTQVFPAPTITKTDRVVEVPQDITQELRPAVAATPAASTVPAAASRSRAQANRLYLVTCGLLAVLLVLTLSALGYAGWISTRPTATMTVTAASTTSPNVTLTSTLRVSPSPAATRTPQVSTPTPTSGTPGSPFIPLPVNGAPTITPWPTNTRPPTTP